MTACGLDRVQHIAQIDAAIPPPPHTAEFGGDDTGGRQALRIGPVEGGADMGRNGCLVPAVLPARIFRDDAGISQGLVALHVGGAGRGIGFIHMKGI